MLYKQNIAWTATWTYDALTVTHHHLCTGSADAGLGASAQGGAEEHAAPEAAGSCQAGRSTGQTHEQHPRWPGWVSHVGVGVGARVSVTNAKLIISGQWEHKFGWMRGSGWPFFARDRVATDVWILTIYLFTRAYSWLRSVMRWHRVLILPCFFLRCSCSDVLIPSSDDFLLCVQGHEEPCQVAVIMLWISQGEYIKCV